MSDLTTSGLEVDVNSSGLGTNTSGVSIDIPPTTISTVPTFEPIVSPLEQADVKVKEEVVQLEKSEQVLSQEVAKEEAKEKQEELLATKQPSSKDWEGEIKTRIKQLDQSIRDAPQEQFKTIPNAVKAELLRLLEL